MAGDIPTNLAFRRFDPVGGATNKPPIIFLHGLTSSKEHWKNIPQTVATATGRKAYAVDARNHGDSEWSDVSNYSAMVEDLLHFMDSMKLQKAVLVGHSMGGIVSMMTSLREPGRVEKLAVEDIHTNRVSQASRDILLAYMRQARASLQKVPDGSDQDTAQKFVVDYMNDNLPKELVPKNFKQKWAEIDLKRTSDGRYSFRFNIDAIDELLQSGDGTRRARELTGIYKGPTSFLYGGLSPYKVGEEKEHIEKFFPAAGYVKIENATHRVHGDCPREFTEALVHFLLE